MSDSPQVSSWKITELGSKGQYPYSSINILPDDVLLEIFDLFVTLPEDYSYPVSEGPKLYEDAWHTLIHVCQRWRSIVFTSSRRLHLVLFCTNKTPVKKMLNIWPAFPILIYAYSDTSLVRGFTNLLAALKQHDRVYKVNIRGISKSLLKQFGAMKTPFPALTELKLRSYEKSAPVLPDSFMGGSAPLLQELFLRGIPFPTLPRLLSSTHDLFSVQLWDIPRSGYISPEMLVTCLSALPNLDLFELSFRSPRSRPCRESRRLPSPTRVILPTLTRFYFGGDRDYLEDIISTIDIPLLRQLVVRFFNQLTFNTPFLRHFIGRTETFKAPNRASVQFRDGSVHVTIYWTRAMKNSHISFGVTCKPSDWQVWLLKEFWGSSLSPLLTLETLEISEYREHWHDDTQVTQWLELLRPFTSMKNLILHKKMVQLVAPALRVFTQESGTEALPALEKLSLRGPQPSGPVKEAIGAFVVTRQLSGHPVVVDHRDVDDSQTY